MKGERLRRIKGKKIKKLKLKIDSNHIPNNSNTNLTKHVKSFYKVKIELK